MSPPLPGALLALPAGSRGLDTASKLTASSAQALHSEGFAFALRYLSLGAPSAGDLTRAEAEEILDAGLGLGAVQHCRYPGWEPTAGLGDRDGARAAKHASAIGLPPGMVLWCDLESVASPWAALSVVGYVDRWCAAVRSAGYDPGLYVGCGCGLSGEGLWGLSVRRYWHSNSWGRGVVPAKVGPRGYQLLQRAQCKVAGVLIDPDEVQADGLGDLPVWLVRAEKG